MPQPKAPHCTITYPLPERFKLLHFSFYSLVGSLARAIGSFLRLVAHSLIRVAVQEQLYCDFALCKIQAGLLVVAYLERYRPSKQNTVGNRSPHKVSTIQGSTPYDL